MKDTKALIPAELIESKIYLIRSMKVILDKDLAQLYGVETRVLNQSVRRNFERFPADFMFALTRDEIMRISQIVISPDIKFSKNVCAFTQEGVAMLSSVLRSKRAVLVNIAIMRTFIKLRLTLFDNKDLRRELEEMKRETNDLFQIVFETLDQLLAVETRPRRKIGFTAKEKRAAYAVKQNTGKQTGREKCVSRINLAGCMKFLSCFFLSIKPEHNIIFMLSGQMIMSINC